MRVTQYIETYVKGNIENDPVIETNDMEFSFVSDIISYLLENDVYEMNNDYNTNVLYASDFIEDYYTGNLDRNSYAVDTGNENLDKLIVTFVKKVDKAIRWNRHVGKNILEYEDRNKIIGLLEELEDVFMFLHKVSH